MGSALAGLECSRCGSPHDPDVPQQRCTSCGGTLLCRYQTSVSLATVRARDKGMWRYTELLPLRGEPVSLGEPETPLLAMPRLSSRWGVEAWIKDDGPLPGGTFKARGAAAAVSRVRELGIERVVMPTAGNAGGAWALYAARAGIALTVTMAQDAPVANRVEVTSAGAKLVLVPGTLADAGRRARELASEQGAFLAWTFGEPYRLEGKKTAFLEAYDALGQGGPMRVPRTVVVPLGGGVAAMAAVKAAQEAVAAGWTSDPAPVLVGVQPDSCAPIAEAFEKGWDEVRPWTDDGGSVAAGLRVPAPAEGTLVLRWVRESGGTVVTVSEDEIRSAIVELASSEGVFACPEGAATMAGAAKLAARGLLEGPVLVYNTGAGVKYAADLA